VVLIAVIAAGAGGVYFGYPYYQAARHLQLARHQFDILEMDDAKASLEACLVEQPDNAEAHFLLGRIHRMIDEFPAADRHLQKAKEHGWSEAAITIEYLLLQVQEQGLITKDNFAAQQMRDTDSPDRPLLLQALAMGSNRKNRLDRASYWLLFWIDSYPQDWRARFSYGMYLQNLGRLDLAQPEFEKALALNPAALPAERWLGIVLTKNGQNYAEGVRHLESYLQEHPDDPLSLIALAQARWALNQPDEARATLKRLFVVAPNHVGGLLLQAQLDEDTDRLTEALDALQRAEKYDSTDMQEISARVALRAHIHRLRGEDKEAEIYERRSQEMKDDFQEIQKDLSTLMKDSKDLSKHRDAGVRFLRVGQKREGLRWLSNLLMMRPDDAVAHRTLADFYAKELDDLQESIRQARKTLAQRPDDAPAKKVLEDYREQRRDRELEAVIKMHRDAAAQGQEYP
jgi:tetratricopeptide (TPR) repeat protein